MYLSINIYKIEKKYNEMNCDYGVNVVEYSTKGVKYFR